MFVLAWAANRLTKFKILLSNMNNDAITDYINGIRSDTFSPSTENFANGLKRIG